MNKFYHPLLTMAGEPVEVGAAPAGGPCGAPVKVEAC
jgi:hypothetical protein